MVAGSPPLAGLLAAVLQAAGCSCAALSPAVSCTMGRPSAAAGALFTPPPLCARPATAPQRTFAAVDGTAVSPQLPPHQWGEADYQLKRTGARARAPAARPLLACAVVACGGDVPPTAPHVRCQVQGAARRWRPIRRRRFVPLSSHLHSVFLPSPHLLIFALFSYLRTAEFFRDCLAAGNIELRVRPGGHGARCRPAGFLRTAVARD